MDLFSAALPAIPKAAQTHRLAARLSPEALLDAVSQVCVVSSPSAVGEEESQPCSRNPRIEPAVEFYPPAYRLQKSSKASCQHMRKAAWQNVPVLNPTAVLPLERVPWYDATCMCLHWHLNTGAAVPT